MAELPFNYRFVKSPNFTRVWIRKRSITGIVLHWMNGTLASTDAHFKNKSSAVSAHYGVEGNNVHQYVKEKDIAWHARQANSYSIGIEISAAPGRAPSDKTYETVIELVARICKQRGFNVDKVLAPHCLYVATRCPGTDTKGKVDEKGGVDFARIKKGVKAKLKPSKPKAKPAPKKSKKKSIDTIAKEVIAGKWGNGPTRVQLLKKAGYNPSTVQARVNQLMKRRR